MKKLFAAIAALFAVAMFASCNLENDGTYEYATATAYFVGEPTGWAFTEMVYNEANGLNELEIEAVAGSRFKLTPVAGWGNEWNNANLAAEGAAYDFLDDPYDEYGKKVTVFAEAGKYKISMNVAKEEYTIKKL